MQYEDRSKIVDWQEELPNSSILLVLCGGQIIARFKARLNINEREALEMIWVKFYDI